MQKTYMTMVVDNCTSREVLAHLEGLKHAKVTLLADGDFYVSERDLTKLTNEVWLHDLNGEGQLALVKAEGDVLPMEGRLLDDDEMQALTEYGVCLEFRANHSDASKYGAPAFALHEEAAMAEAAHYGFAVAPHSGFTSDVRDTGDDTAQQTWLRIRVPAWINFAGL